MERGLKATKRDINILLSDANLLIDLGKIEEAEKILKELQATEYRGPQIGLVEARIDYARGRWRTARDGFEKIRGAMVTSNWAKQIDVWIGDCYGHLGNPDQQSKYINLALSADPNFRPALIAQTNTSLASGNVNVALEGIRQLSARGDMAPAGAWRLPACCC